MRNCFWLRACAISLAVLSFNSVFLSLISRSAINAFKICTVSYVSLCNLQECDASGGT